MLPIRGSVKTSYVVHCRGLESELDVTVIYSHYLEN